MLDYISGDVLVRGALLVLAAGLSGLAVFVSCPARPWNGPPHSTGRRRPSSTAVEYKKGLDNLSGITVKRTPLFVDSSP